jgi:hypothetical protein
MKKLTSIVLVLSIVIMGGCVSKRYAKKGLKFEQAGLYEMAADLYYQSMVANPKNVDAAIGLKKNGQRLLDDKGFEVSKAYLSGDDKEVVYRYIEAKAYMDKVNATGVNISLSPMVQGYYDDVKPRYLSKLFDEARLLLEEEKFRESEIIFSEIKRVDPLYQGVDEHMKVSQSEPLYRAGMEFLINGLFRSAYANFNSIITTHGTYKDSKDLRDESLAKGMITISIETFRNNSNNKDAGTILQSKIISDLNGLNNPFIKVVDAGNTEQYISQQRQTSSIGANVQVGQMLAPKAVLRGTVIKFNTNDGKFKREEKRGYLKEEITIKDKTSGEEKKENKYHKVTYIEISKENNVETSFQYQLNSTETSAVLVSDAINQNVSDAIHYATFNGDKSKLVPGYWEFPDKNSPKDKIDDSLNAVKALQNLLSANQNIKPVSTLQIEAIEKISSRVAHKINQYNPEK